MYYFNLKAKLSHQMQDITYCLSCKKDTRNINPKIVKTKNNRKMMLT